jgi:hypothetical protein
VCGSNARGIGEGCRVEPRRYLQNSSGERDRVINAWVKNVYTVEGYVLSLSLGETRVSVWGGMLG